MSDDDVRRFWVRHARSPRRAADANCHGRATLKTLCAAMLIALLAACAESTDTPPPGPAPTPAPPAASGPLPEGGKIGRPAGYADLCKREPENFLCRP